MNEFERRLLDTSETAVYLQEYVKANGRTILAIDDFVYSSGPALEGVLPGVSVQDLIPIQADSEFLVFEMSGSGFLITPGVRAATFSPPAKVQFTDTGSNRSYFNQPTNFGNVLGSAGYPLILPVPRIIPPNTNIKIDLTNTDLVDTIDAYISFIGVRIYYSA